MPSTMNPISDENEKLSGSDKPRRKRGRPPGSKNKPREVVNSIPTCCPACGSSELRIQSVLKEWPRPGSPDPPYIVKRRRFARMVWSHARCVKCDKYLRIVQHMDEIISE